MTAISITPGYPNYSDTDGSALNDGYVYIGLEYQNPITAPTGAFWDKDFQIPADQPLRTSGGYIVRNGSPAAVYTGAAYSILVQNKNLVTVYNAPSAVITNVTNTVEDITQYQGAHAIDPLARNDGTPLQVGDLYFNTAINELKVWTGSVWAPASPGSVIVQNFTGTGSQTAFNLATEPIAENNTQIYIDGVYQQKNTYALAGATINFSTAPPNLSTIEVVTFSIASLGTADAANVSYDQGGTGAVEQSVQSKLQELVSVKDFGATGDGVTDDATAITAAIAEGGLVYFPSGTYLFNTALTVPDHVILQGEGNGATNAATILKYSGTADGVSFAGASGDPTRWAGLRDLTIQTTSTATSALYLKGTQDCIFENVSLVDSGGATDGLKIEATVNFGVYTNTFIKVEGSGFTNGLNMDGDTTNSGTLRANENRFVACRFDSNTTGLRIKGCDTVDLVGCSAETNTTGIIVEGSAAGSASLRVNMLGGYLENTTDVDTSDSSGGGNGGIRLICTRYSTAASGSYLSADGTMNQLRTGDSVNDVAFTMNIDGESYNRMVQDAGGRQVYAQAATSNKVLTARVTTDAVARFELASNGTMTWGGGSGAVDTTMKRSAAGLLKNQDNDNFPVSSGTTGGAASAGAGNQYVELSIGGTVYKVLHDGTV